MLLMDLQYKMMQIMIKYGGNKSLNAEFLYVKLLLAYDTVKNVLCKPRGNYTHRLSKLLKRKRKESKIITTVTKKSTNVKVNSKEGKSEQKL